MDQVNIAFDPSSLMLINLIVALMMFGVSLDLRAEDFTRVVREPRAPVIGLVAQFLLLPALTCLACWALRIEPQLALGMTLVAACPGGSFSNIMTWLARGNVAVSVSMTAVSSLAASVLTPLNFAFYAWLNPHTRPLLTEIAIDPLGLLLLVVLVLGVPLLLGMSIGRRLPGLARRVEKPLRFFSLAVMLGFVALAFSRNLDQFLAYFHLFFWLVVAHNALALLIGYASARLAGLDDSDRRAVTLETGIQNSALGLVIIFTFFPQAGGMPLIAAFWGCWHLVSGLSLAWYWSRRPPRRTRVDERRASHGARMMTVALITGAASGLGWQLARACHARGDSLLLTDIDATGLAARVAELGDERVLGVAGDITCSALQQQLLDTCQARFGRLDVLINNAGITHRSPTVLTAPQVFRKVMAVDYHAPLELTLSALPMLRASRGQVVVIGSMAGWLPVLGRAGYCAAKGALGQVFEVLRAEIARDGIGLLMVYPSFLDTPIERNALGADGRPAGHARSTIGRIRGADWMAASIVRAQERRQERLFPDRGSLLASLLWRVAPALYHRKMCQRFAGEMDVRHPQK